MFDLCSEHKFDSLAVNLRVVNYAKPPYMLIYKFVWEFYLAPTVGAVWRTCWTVDASCLSWREFWSGNAKKEIAILSRHLLSAATWKWPCNSYLLRQEVGWVAQNRSGLLPPLERTDRIPVVWIISLQYLYPPERDIAVSTHHALLRHRRLFTFGQTAWNERVTVFFSHILSLKRLDRFLWNLTQGRQCECCWVNLFVLMVRKYKNNFTAEACVSNYGLQVFVFFSFLLLFLSLPPVGLSRHCVLTDFSFVPLGVGGVNFYV